jgi:hypothetical protein
VKTELEVMRADLQVPYIEGAGIGTIQPHFYDTVKKGEIKFKLS